MNSGKKKERLFWFVVVQSVNVVNGGPAEFAAVHSARWFWGKLEKGPSLFLSTIVSHLLQEIFIFWFSTDRVATGSVTQCFSTTALRHTSVA